MNKKAFFSLACGLGALLLQSCDMADLAVIVHDISTAEEFFGMSANKKYRLTADIDLQGQAWTPIKIADLDGNGHSIRNFRVAETVEHGKMSPINVDYGFFTSANSIHDVTFSDFAMNIQALDADLTFGAVAGNVNKMFDVTVENGTIAIVSTKYDVMASCCVGFASDYLSGITVRNVSLTASGNESVSASGILSTSIGLGKYSEDLLSENNNITAQGYGASAYGIGWSVKYESNTGIVSCNNTIVAASKRASLSEYAAGVGNVIGSQAVVSRGNTVEAKSVSGIGGCDDSTDLLSIGNKLISNGTDEDYACGVSKSIDGCKRIMSIDNAFEGEAVSYGISETFESPINGAVSKGMSASGDLFCEKADSSTYFRDCYIGPDSDGPNVNEIPSIDLVGYRSLIDTLSLNPEIWKIGEDGEYALTVE